MRSQTSETFLAYAAGAPQPILTCPFLSTTAHQTFPLHDAPTRSLPVPTYSADTAKPFLNAPIPSMTLLRDPSLPLLISGLLPLQNLPAPSMPSLPLRTVPLRSVPKHAHPLLRLHSARLHA